MTNASESVDETLSIEAVKSFLSHFAENQNHHQKVFLQFLSSIIIVLTGYAFVYTNTIGYNGIIINGQLYRPDIFDPVKTDKGDILSYSVLHLVTIYLFAQVLLLILAWIVLHMGYSFRRDQSIVFKIRHTYLGKEKFEGLFGKHTLNALNKSIINYLPNFNSILFYALLFIQGVLYGSIYLYLNQFPGREIFANDLLHNNPSFYKIKILLAFPVILMVVFYVFYFYKYNRKVSKAEYYDRLTGSSEINRKVFFRLGWGSLLIVITSLILHFITTSMLCLVLALFYSCSMINYFARGYLSINGSTDNDFKNFTINLTTAFLYLIAGLIILINGITAIMSPQNLKYVDAAAYSLFFLVIASLIILYGINWSDRKSETMLFIQNQLGNNLLLLIVSLVVFLFISVTQINWTDKAAAMALAAMMSFYSFNRFSASIRVLLNR